MNFGFSTDFHTRINPLTSRPTPFYRATSATPIRMNAHRSNNYAVHKEMYWQKVTIALPCLVIRRRCPFSTTSSSQSHLCIRHLSRPSRDVGVYPERLVALSFSDLFLSRFDFKRLTLDCPFFATFLCFHVLTHSFAPAKSLSSMFSMLSALFAQNTRGGVPRISKRSICRPSHRARNCHELSSRQHRTLNSLFAPHRHRPSMPSARRRSAVWAL